MNNTIEKRYNAIDGLRAIACILIISMHMNVNNNYHIKGFFYNRVIPSFTNLVFLFMALSAFGMCCGYYKKILDNKVNFSSFYKKRFMRILPFFSILVLIDICVKPSLNKLYEGFADLTLMFGFGSKRLSVIGVAWFIGTIFVFYLVFPFFCTLLENKKRAWVAFALSIIWNVLAIIYFDLDRMNILYSGCFFVLGGLLYLYKDKISKVNRWIGLVWAIVSIAIYYLLNAYTFKYLLVSASLIAYAIMIDDNSKSILTNRVLKFISSISLELFLSHMFIFRIVELAGLNKCIQNDVLQYIVTLLLTIGGSICFAVLLKKAIDIVEEKLVKGVKKN